MGDGYADPDLTEKVPAAPYGNNSLREKNVISIADLKTQFATIINSDNGYKQIEKDMMIKAVVTGNDVSGNIYNQVSVQDASGAIIIAINGSGLSGYLPVGQEILVNLKGLYIGSYKKLPQIGGVNTKLSDGSLGIGKIERAIWNQHFKILNPGEADASTVVPEEFDLTKLTDAAYMDANVGKLMTLKKVKFASANGTNVWAPDDTNTSLELIDAETGKRISSSDLVVRNSGYSKFANEVVPQGVFDITGIFTRFGDTWQIVLRNTDDLKSVVLAYISEPFDASQGNFTIDNIKLADGVEFVWKWASAAYGMKASGYVNGSKQELQSRLKSPAIDLKSAKSAKLMFDQAINFASDMKQECKVQISTDGKTWTDLDVQGYPTENSWTFVSSTADLTKYCGKTIYIGFLYSSTPTSAPTWEVKNFAVK
jgi:putative lipoprotein